MEEISIVKRRSRLWPIVLTLLVIALIVLAALWMMGDTTTAGVSWNSEDLRTCEPLEGRTIRGTA